MLVVVTGPNSSLGKPIRKALRYHGHQCIKARRDDYDLSTEKGIEDLTDLCETADALVHCAGIMQPDEDPRWQDNINAISYIRAIQRMPTGAPAIAMLDNTGTVKLHRHFRRYYQSKALLRQAVVHSQVACRPIGFTLGYVTKHARQSAKSFNRLRAEYPRAADKNDIADFVLLAISGTARNALVDLSGGMPYIAP